MAHLIVLIDSPHPPLALCLRDNLARILDDNLIRLKAPIATHPIATVLSLNDLDANVELAACFTALTETAKATVAAEFFGEFAIRIITFVEHEAVLAIFIATGLTGASARGHFGELSGFPDRRCVAYEDV